MSSSRHSKPMPRGFTLLEMTLVIGLLLALIGMTTMTYSGITKWQAGREASETLRSVYIAQRTYFADHPTASVGSLSRSDLLPYIPNGPASFPQIEGLDGSMRDIKVTVSPPVVIDSSGSVYDPSGKSNDSLWDVGE